MTADEPQTTPSPIVRHHGEGCEACSWMAREIHRLRALLAERADQADRLTRQEREIATLAAELQAARHVVEGQRAELNRVHFVGRAAA
ncbi:hypothetical protein [Microbacterium xylanilyticum]